MAQASYGYFGFGVETTPGTAVPPTKFLPVKDVDFPIDTEFIEIREISGSRQAYSSFDGPVRPDVNFTTAFYPSAGMAVLLRGLFGSHTSAPVSGSTTAYTHTFKDAASLPSLSFERADARADGQGIILQRLNGCKIESMGFSCAYGEDVEVSVNAQGLGFPTTPGAKPVTFTYPTMNPFIFTGASVDLDGVPSLVFKSVDFEFTNTLERQEALNKTREAYKILEGGIDCTLSGTLVFDDLTIYNKFKNSQYMTVTITFAGDLADATPTPDVFYSARFHWPKVKVSSYGIPMTAGEVMEADVEFAVQFDRSYGTNGALVDVQLVNLDTGATFTT
jgi:hypothetical protein